MGIFHGNYNEEAEYNIHFKVSFKKVMSQNLELRPRENIFLGRSIFITDIILELPIHDDILKINFQLVLLLFLSFSTDHASPYLPDLQMGRYTDVVFVFSW